MTQKAIARESPIGSQESDLQIQCYGENMGGFMTVDAPAEQVAYMPWVVSLPWISAVA